MNQIPTAIDSFLGFIQQAAQENTLQKITLSKYKGAEPELQRLQIRPVLIRNEPQLSFVYSYKTRDITKNYSVTEACRLLTELIPAAFKNAYLFTQQKEHHLEVNKKGKVQLHSKKIMQRGAITTEHNREKNRWVDIERPYLTRLGITDEQHQLIPTMSRKWKQINKFIEVFGNALTNTSIDTNKSISVVDFGCGKGYLTFAIDDYLRHTLNNSAQVIGVELRKPLVDLCNQTVSSLENTGLSFICGDVKTYAPQKIDVMIALHACDTATDYAIDYGIKANASIIMCSPCCHKQIRPQMHSPDELKGMLQYGIHLGQEAEMVTDTLRALLLEAHGYDAKVFEFISLEHTNKNKMILAVKNTNKKNMNEAWEQIAKIKTFYGISEHCLEVLLQE